MTDTERARGVIERAVENEQWNERFHSVTITSAIFAALAEAGLVIRPVEPTRAMLDAAGNDLLGRTMWELMVEAEAGVTSPASPPPAEPESEKASP